MAEQALWPEPIKPALQRLRQKNHKFKASLGNTVRPCQMGKGKRRGGKGRRRKGRGVEGRGGKGKAVLEVCSGSR